jgi:replicative DNA helicase
MADRGARYERGDRGDRGERGGDRGGDRTPPHALEAEKSLLGAVLVENNAIYEVADIVVPEDFYREVNGTLYRMFLTLSEEKLPIDLTTVMSRLSGDKSFEGAGGAVYLSEVLQDVPTAANVRHYAKLVKEKSLVRRLIGTAQDIAREGFGEIGQVEDFIADAERKIFEVAQDKMRQPFKPIRDLIKETFGALEKRFEMRRLMNRNEVFVTGVTTGFENLDRLTAGLQKGDLVILAARPSMGKCLSARMKLDDPNTGERLTIEEYVKQKRTAALSISSAGNIQKTEIKEWVDSGIKPCFRVRTRTGREVEVTGHHPFLTIRGWEPLSQLKAGDKIAIPRCVPVFGDREQRPSLIRLLAYLIAGGSLRGRHIKFYHGDPKVVADFCHSVTESFPECVIKRQRGRVIITTQQKQPDPMKDWIKANGIEEKSFPALVWSLPKSQISLFLSALMSYLAMYQKSPEKLWVSSLSLPFIQDVQHALTRLGIVSTLIYKTLSSWRLEIKEPDALARYQREFGASGEQPSPPKEERSEESIYWDEITVIKPIGDQHVYDLAVPEFENFIAQDIFVHNTALALNFAQNASLKKNVGVLVCSLEMGATQLVERMLASEARIQASKMRVGDLMPEDFTKLMNTASRIQKSPLYIDDTAAISVTEVRAKARRLAAEQPLGMILIDYLQLMRGKPSAAKEGREKEISDISRGLKALAKEMEVPVVALSQLNRSLEQRADKRPQLSDLRECVTGDTLVHLADGRRVPIERLVGEAPEVLSFDADGNIVTAKSEIIWEIGEREVFEIETESGKKFCATAEHKVFSAHGWRTVGQLQEGDYIATARALPEPKETIAWPDSHVILLGHMIGDGSYLNQQPMRYTTASEENSAAVKDAAEQGFGVTVKRYKGKGSWHQLLLSGNGNRWHPAGVNKWMRDLGIFGQRSHEKRIPEDAFRLSNKQIALLLRHLWATDGCLFTPNTTNTSSKVYYATNSYGLAQDVTALLLRLGIITRTYKTDQDQYRPMYHVTVSGVENQKLFIHQVGAFGSKISDIEKLKKHIANIKSNTNVDIVPRAALEQVFSAMKDKGISKKEMAEARGLSTIGTKKSFMPSRKLIAEYAEILKDKKLQSISNSDIFWDKISLKKSDGKKKVFDITVPSTQSWVGNFTQFHNSGAIEQDADVIMFIYRDEYYNKDTPDQGIAEVIIAKQRNGPTDTVRLKFFGEYTRFDNLIEDNTAGPAPTNTRGGDDGESPF